jgi:hypothetical protein
MFTFNKSDTDIVKASTVYACAKWSVWFDNALWNLIDEDDDPVSVRRKVILAREIADAALEEYDNRWGKRS